MLFAVLYAIVIYVIWYLIINLPFYYIDKAVYAIAKFLDGILDFGEIDLRFGVVPTMRVIINGLKMLILWFCASIAIRDETNISFWTVTIAMIVGIIIKKQTVTLVVRSAARKYVDEKLAQKAPFSEKEFLKIKRVDYCQRWNIKTNGKVTFYFVRDTLRDVIISNSQLTDSIQKEDRIFLYREFAIMIPYLEELGIQMDRLLPDDYWTVSDAGFCSQKVYGIQKEKIGNIIDVMGSTFSLDNVYNEYKDTTEMTSYLPTDITATEEEKHDLFCPIIHHELNDLKNSQQISEVPPTKENVPIIYNKIQQGLVNEKGIYIGEPDFGGAGCQDCGVHTMPEDDEEDELT